MNRVLCIGGYGRSGSTVLDTLLGNHPGFFGAGELSHVFSETIEGGRCSCGAAYGECFFWSEVLKVLGKRLAEVDLREMRGVTRKVERFPKVIGSHGTKAVMLYSKVWATLLDALKEVSGKDVIVDSSKTARLCWYRIASLAMFCHAEVNVIHLVRDPRAVSWSVLRGSNREIVKGKGDTLLGGVYRAVLGWTLANLCVHRTKSRIPYLKVGLVRYEDLVKDPVKELKRIEVITGIKMDPVLDIAKGSRCVEPGHGVGGNRLRREGPFQIKEDNEWKTSLPDTARIVASVLSWPLARKYGYDVLGKV